MSEKDYKDILKPIFSAVERLVPTNRQLLNFVNEKAIGKDMKRSIYKVKFLDKAEKSTKQLSDVTLIEFKKHLKERKIEDEEAEILIKQAEDILNDAQQQVEKVYAEVRRYIVTSELRGDCVKHNFRKIPSLDDAKNETISKEIFSLALAEVNKGENHNLDDVEEQFKKINDIALALFGVIAATTDNHPTPEKIQKTHKELKKQVGFLERLFS